MSLKDVMTYSDVDIVYTELIYQKIYKKIKYIEHIF